jgi:hypothetical protein
LYVLSVFATISGQHRPLTTINPRRMNMLFYLCSLAALVAFFGFFLHARGRNGHGMAYSAVLVSIWIAAALWSGGYLNG